MTRPKTVVASIIPAIDTMFISSIRLSEWVTLVSHLLLTSICDLSTHHAGEAPRPETPAGATLLILRPLAVASLAARAPNVSCPRRARSLAQAATLRSRDRSGRTAAKGDRPIAPCDRRDQSKDTAMKASYSPFEPSGAKIDHARLSREGASYRPSTPWTRQDVSRTLVIN